MEIYVGCGAVMYVSGARVKEILEKEGFREAMYYDGYDDEAPLQIEVSKLADASWYVLEIDKEEGTVRVHLDRGYSLKETLKVVLNLISLYVRNGEMAVIGREFSISWSGRENGWCDSDGGEYCYELKPVIWKNPVTKQIEYYMLTESSCEICEPKIVVMLKKTGKLVDIEEQYFDKNMHEKVYSVVVGNVEEISEPYHDLDEFVDEWWKWVLTCT